MVAGRGWAAARAVARAVARLPGRAGRLPGPEAVAGTVATSSDNFILTRQGSLGWELRAIYFRVLSCLVRSGPVGFFLGPL